MSDPEIEEEPPLPKDEKQNDPPTRRAKAKMQEDEKYVPVIIKRTDESRRHPDDTLEQTIHEGLEQLNRQSLSLFISAIAAGLILGFSAMAVGVVQTYFGSADSTLVERFVTALVYPLGFVVCVMSGSELFTEHTATAVYPVLDRRSTVRRLFRLWSLVLSGNLLGAFISALLLHYADPVVGAAVGYIEVGHHLTHFETLPLFISSVLAGWLMAQGAWLVMSTPANLSQMACIYLVTFVIGLGGLHHAIAGSVEIFIARLTSPEFTLGSMLHFMGFAIAGNTVGGAGFVALLNYAHVRRTRTLGDRDDFH
ncbi:formate/nitrite transporter family protein [Pelagicoccus sp. NFK12]|uniref:Formate/nitrite transporter family protein n=1 Tax=Pelagicoccus enzymogenes TaxID=2773457 RepID=A0A927FDK5_9BACT|nr:formate/nitrite transporter family protein [Pelagicoccus enzymogenes]MBD5782395.1 formate/nitrite transporter family protein [Pelagicoccus enzymogenes]MDQ8200973.1 formate/nitrite transporter family protein [Pelagicoccus enzymogenes]